MPPDAHPPAAQQSNLTDPDSALMRRSDAHEYRQAYNAQAVNAQAVVCADGTQLILATKLVATSADAPSFAATILGMEATVGLPAWCWLTPALPAARRWRTCKPTASSP